MEKQKVRAMMKPEMMLMIIDQTMPKGRTREASLISSAVVDLCQLRYRNCKSREERTHVNGAVRSDHRVHGTCQPNEHRKTLIRPAAVVSEVGEDGFGGCSRSEHPERDDDGEKADEM